MTKFHNFKFKLKEKTTQKSLEEYLKLKVFVKIADDEACLYTLNGGGSYSLYLQDRFFNFNIENESKNVGSFEGDIQLSKIKFMQLQLPENVKDIILSLDTSIDLPCGCGGYIKFNAEDVYYDKQYKILQIGNIHPDQTIYRFFNNAYTQVKNGEISGIMVTELEL